MENVGKSKKKKRVIIAAIVLLLVLLIPFPLAYKDGGTVKFQAVLYSVTNKKQLWTEEGADGYLRGREIRILGIEVFNNVKFVPYGTD